MVKKKFFKVIVATLCILALIMPHTSVVLAALTNKIPNDVNTVTLIDSVYHKNGYWYAVLKGGTDATKTNILKISNSDDTENMDSFYCLDATKQFPTGWDGNDSNGISYKRDIEDFFASNGMTISNYNSLCWLLNNIYLYNLYYSIFI